MRNFWRVWLTSLTLLACVAAVVAKDGPNVVVGAPQGDFQRSIAKVAFGSDGRLFAAYRIRGGGANTEAVRLIAVDPVAGKIEVERSYPAPKAALPRIVDDLVVSPDGGLLVYAELHRPAFIAVFQSQTLDLLSSSAAQLFGAEDFIPKVSGTTQTSVLLSSERRTPTAGVRVIALDLKNVDRVREDSVLPFQKDEGRNYAVDAPGRALWFGDARSWFKHDIKTGQRQGEMHANQDVGTLIPSDGILLGLTDKNLAGWMQLFDSNGKELADTRNEGCGFVQSRLSPDGKFGVAVCDKTGLGEAHFGETIERQAVVFEVRTLKVVASIPLSRKVIKERGANRADFWTAIPTPALWHESNRLLLAVPEFPDSIPIYSITLDK